MSAELIAEDLTFGYEDGRDVIRGVGIRLVPGRLTGIVGPNGAGKSTLLRIMAGILKVRSGRVLLDGAGLETFGRRELARRLAFLPQGVTSVFNMKARDVVTQGRFPHTGLFGFVSRGDERVVDSCLERTDTSRLAHRPLDSLSGGERQRVLVASILAQQPEIMLLDEPTASLDIHHQSDVFELLWGLSRDGLSVAAVTHDLNLAAQFCDTLVLLEDGSSVVQGTPEEVLRQDVLEKTYRTTLLVTRNPVHDSPMVVVTRKDYGKDDAGGRNGR